jgi:hypothetical protein
MGQRNKDFQGNVWNNSWFASFHIGVRIQGNVKLTFAKQHKPQI